MMWTASTIGEVLRANSDTRPDAPALRGVEDSLPLTHAQLHHFAQTVGETLRGAGVGRGDVVLIALPDGPEAFAALLATSSVATAFPVSAVETAAVYERLFDEIDIRAVLMGDRPAAPLAHIAAARGATLLRTTPGVAGEMFVLKVDRPNHARVREAPRPTNDAIFIATSGSTGAPKIVACTHESVVTGARRFAEWNELTAHDRSLCVMPITHMHSLARSSLPLLVQGGEVIWAPAFRARDALAWIDRLKPTMMTGAPSIFRALLGEAKAQNWRPAPGVLEFTSVGSDRVEAELTERMQSMLQCHVAQFYVLSETAPFIAQTPRHRSMPRDAAGRINPDWRVALVDDDGAPALKGASGEIVVSGGHINRLVGRSQRQHRLDSEGRLKTGDLGRIENGFLYVEGRIDDRINRGGEKIEPEAVEKALLRHPSIQRAVVFGVPDLVLGQRVAALVVAKPGAASKERELRAFAAERSTRSWAPEFITFVEAIPTSHLGKISRRDLALAFTATSLADTRVSAGDLSDLDEPLLKIMRKHAQNPVLQPDEDFFENGGDSFGAVELVLEIEETFGVAITPAELVECSTAVLLEQRIRQNASGLRADKVVEIPVETRDLQIVFAPGVKGIVGYEPKLATILKDRVSAVFLQVREIGGQITGRDVPFLARQLAPSIQANDAVLAGHSMGAHIAVALAHNLLEAGRTPRFVAVFDDFADLSKRNFGVLRDVPSHRDVAICNKWALDCSAVQPFAGRIVFFVSERTKAQCRSDPTAGWDEIALGGVDIVETAGDHNSIVGARIAELGAALLAKLDTPLQQSPRTYDEGRRLRYEARVAARRGDLQKEIALYQAAAKRDRDQPFWAYGNLADALWQAERRRDAVAAYRRAVERDPWPLTTDTRFASSLRRDPKELKKALQRARQVTPDDPHMFRLLGDFFYRAGCVEESINVLREGLVANTEDRDLRTLLADVLTSIGKPQEATVLWEEAFAILPASRWLCVRLARHYLNLGAPNDALATIERHLQRRSPGHDVVAANAEALLALGRGEEAAEHLSRIR